MLSDIRLAFAKAFANLRTNFSQALLSVPGTVIGVAALVVGRGGPWKCY